MKEWNFNVKIGEYHLILAILAIVAMFLIIFLPNYFVLQLLALAIVIYLIWQRSLLAFLLAVVLYPFSQAYIFLGSEINIPYSDAIMLALAFVWLGKVLLDSIVNKRLSLSKKSLMNLIPLLLLVGAGSLSFINIWPEFRADSWHYLWRFIAFNYFVYFWLIQELVTRARNFWPIVRVLYLLGIILSFMGFISLLWPEVEVAFPMAAPLSWLGLFPYAASHNLIAEALVSIIPFSWLLAFKNKDQSYKHWLYLGLAFMIGITYLTFSRTGWLVITLELAIIFFFYYRNFIIHLAKRYWWIVLLGMVLLFIYLTTLGQTYFVTSSNAARLAMVERSWELFTEQPWFGQGVGTWQDVLSYDKYYVAEFGYPQEQHGVIWKLLAEQGLVGVLVWFGLFAWWLRKTWQNFVKFSKNNPWRWAALIAAVVVLGQFIFQLFDTGYYSAKMWLPVGLAMALVTISQRYQKLMQD